MYFSLNFRWPLLMGGGCNTNAMQPPVSGSHSAFKALPSSCPNSLPPISSLRADREPGGGGGALPLPPSHHQGIHHQLSEPRSSRQATQSTASMVHQSGSELKNVVCGMTPGMGVPGMGLPGSHGPSHPPHPVPHPAFPMPIGSLVQPPPGADSLGPIQHLMNSNKALALSHYLADPLAKAALMDLGRYGHYPLGKKLFGCPQCRYVTDRKNNLKRHIATMHQECDKVLECCGVVFKNKASLRDHVLIFHSNGYMCRFCGRNFCRKALLKRHLTVHSGQKDYVCSLCDYATSHKSNLERHKKVHERQGSDQEEADSQHDRASLDFSGSHANCTTSCSPIAGYSRDPSDVLRAYQPGQSTSSGYPTLKPSHELRHVSPHSMTSPTSSTSHSNGPLNRHPGAHQLVSSSVATVTSSSRNMPPMMPKHMGGFDLQISSMGHPDIGSYTVDRILNSCKVPTSRVTIEDIDLDDDDEDEDHRDLLDADDADDDTQSSGLIDVVHVDLQD